MHNVLSVKNISQLYLHRNLAKPFEKLFVFKSAGRLFNDLEIKKIVIIACNALKI